MTGESLLELLLLGPLEARVDGRPLRLGGPRERALLARLAVCVNEAVPAGTLVADVWGDDPPRTAANALHVHVARLRRRLGDAAIRTTPGGYLLALPSERVDARRFEAALAHARGAPPPFARARLVSALGEWRGPALAGVEAPFARVEAARLEELRLEALEARIDAELELGLHESVVAELEALLAREPLREGLRGRLMTALYRCGRQAAALRVYREGRTILRDELGLEPSPPLRRLEQAILAQDAELEIRDPNESN